MKPFTFFKWTFVGIFSVNALLPVNPTMVQSEEGNCLQNVYYFSFDRMYYQNNPEVYSLPQQTDSKIKLVMPGSGDLMWLGL